VTAPSVAKPSPCFTLVKCGLLTQYILNLPEFLCEIYFAGRWQTPTVIRVYEEAGAVIETHEHKGDFKGP
jgi:hypothetical protein